MFLGESVPLEEQILRTVRRLNSYRILSQSDWIQKLKFLSQQE